MKGPAEDHFRNAIFAAKAAGKRVVVAGCVPQGSPNVAYLKVTRLLPPLALVPVHALDIVGILAEILPN